MGRRSYTGGSPAGYWGLIVGILASKVLPRSQHIDVRFDQGDCLRTHLVVRVMAVRPLLANDLFCEFCHVLLIPELISVC